MFQSSVDPSLRAGILIIAASFMLLEYLIGRLARHDTHDLKESAASFGVAVIHGLVRPLEAALVAVPFMLAYRHRLFDIDITTAAGLLAVFVAVDLADRSSEGHCFAQTKGRPKRRARLRYLPHRAGACLWLKTVEIVDRSLCMRGLLKDRPLVVGQHR